MRAVVIEIHKNRCIAVTPDGRFVKQSIDQGELEIGDEIMVEARHLARGRDWIRTLAIAAAAAVVIGLGSWGMFNIFGGYRMGGETAMVAEIREDAEEKASDEAMTVTAEQEIAEEEAGMEDVLEESADFAAEIEQVEGIMTGPGEVDAVVDLEITNIGQPAEIIAGNLLLMYRVKEAEENMELLFIAEMLDPDLSFTGEIKVSVLFDNRTIAGEDIFSVKEFSGGDKIQKFIGFESGAYDLSIKINGIFE